MQKPFHRFAEQMALDTLFSVYMRFFNHVLAHLE